MLNHDSKFRADLEIGTDEEKLLAEKLMDLGSFDGYDFNDNADYDIRMFSDSPDGRKYKTYELKFDRYDNDQVAIEVFCLRRLRYSGLLKSKADKFVILKNDKYYFTTPIHLSKVLTPEMFVFGGDGKSSVMALLKVNILEKNSELVINKY